MSEEIESTQEPSGYPWPTDDPRTPSIYSYPGGPPLSFENQEKLRAAYRDAQAWRDFVMHADDEELKIIEARFRASLGE